MAWIAADDARCYDEALRPVLDAVAGAWRPASELRPTSTVALVREVAAHVRAEPAHRDLRVRDLFMGHTHGHSRRAGRAVAAGVAAFPSDAGAAGRRA